ncbi:MAG: hypothetical protein R2940_06915 [Syntrophotaleaceae bacterium]
MSPKDKKVRSLLTFGRFKRDRPCGAGCCLSQKFMVNSKRPRREAGFFDFLLFTSAEKKGEKMARKLNYGYEKRQKELARKAKKEEKRERKQGESTEQSPEKDNG